MAIPYNPSSFATNKTILQAIEELKNYLKNNPCYKVYYVNTAYVVGTYTYNLSDVDDPDDTMTAGDIVFFNNSYYASVTNKDTNTFDIDPAVSFKGATGSAGVSVTGATINSAGHLIITLSDGSSIDAGSVLISYDNTVTISSTSGTLTDDEYNKLLSDDSHIKYDYIYYKAEEGATLIRFLAIIGGSGTTHRHTITITKSTKAYTVQDRLLMVDESNINAGAGSEGQVLTVQNDGTADWETISTGYENTVSITTTSGTFSDSDFAKLGYGDSTIVYTDAYNVSTVYKLKLETTSILEFEAINAASKNNLMLIDVNKTTKAYSMTSVAMIKSATFDSGTATSGKVLTANGSGGCSWETAGGGGSGKYYHDISITGSSPYTRIYLQIITTRSTPYTSISDLFTDFYALYGGNYKGASGCTEVSSNKSVIIAILWNGLSTIGAFVITGGTHSEVSNVSTTNLSIGNDTVITL